MAELMNFIAAKHGEGIQWLSEAEKRTEHITDSDIELCFEQNAPAVKNFGVELQQLLHDRTQGKAWEDMHSAQVGNGLEAYRILKNCNEPKIAGTRRAVLKQVVCIKCAGRADQVEHRSRHLEDLVRRYEGMTGAALPEGLKVTGLIEVCSRELHDNLG